LPHTDKQNPFGFYIYRDDIFNASDLFLTLFTDDTSGLAEKKNLNDLITFVNAELKKLANWFQSNKMAVNISKTKYIIFRTKGKRIINPPPVLFNSNEVGKPEDPALIVPLERIYFDNPNVEERSYKLLGVYLDEYLNFDKHFSFICAKLTRAIYCIGRGRDGGRDDKEPCQQTLNVLFMNSQSLISKINELEVLVVDAEPDLIFICETWCNAEINNASLKISGYEFQTDLRLDRADTAHGVGGGLAVYSKNGLEILVCDRVQQFNQYCKFKIDAFGEELFFYVVYRPPSGGLNVC
jgi:hypothetical protein